MKHRKGTTRNSKINWVAKASDNNGNGIMGISINKTSKTRGFLQGLVFLLVGGVAFGGLTDARADHIPSVIVLDSGGIDQIDTGNGAQQDLAGAIVGPHGFFGFAWDETDLSGANSSDTCTYFGEPDNTVTAVCYSVEFDDSPDGIVDGFPTAVVYSCTEKQYSNGKCAGNTPVSSEYSVACTAPALVAPYFGTDLDDDDDLQATCTLTAIADPAPVDSLLLLNTCTKPSASPSSLSNDCLFGEIPAFLQLTKEVLDGDKLATDFTLTATGADTISGNGDTQLIPVTPGAYSLTETESGEDLYQLASLECSTDGGDADMLGDEVTLATNTATVCTFTNELSFVAAPDIIIIKEASDTDNDGLIWNDKDDDGYPDAGETIDYTFDVKNTGNVLLTEVFVSDSKVGAIFCPNFPDAKVATVTLEPGQSVECTATYVILQSDIELGKVDNEATAWGIAAQGESPSDTGVETVTLPKNPSLTIVKTLTNAEDAIVDTAGEIIEYTITVENDGNVDLTTPVLGDTFAGGATFVSGDNANVGVLDTDETWTYSADYTVTQDDLNTGTALLNVATVDTDQTAQQQNDATSTVDQNPSLTIVKVVAETTITQPGTLNYTITVDNTGNVDLTKVALTDTFAGGATLDSGDANSNSILETTETWIYKADYEATQADINAGTTLHNVASVDTEETINAKEDFADTTITQTPSLTIVKVVAETTITQPGTLNYTITVDNTGNVDLTKVALTDTFAGGATLDSGDQAVGVVGNGILETDEIWTYTADYDATQADIDKDEDLVNTASVVTYELPDPEEASATTTVIAVLDLCVAGKGGKMLPPGEMLFQYDGVNDTVWIVVEHPKDGIIFEGPVSDGGIFLLDRDGPESRKLNPRLDTTIYSYGDEEGRTGIIDSFSIHTSCSDPLLIGDTYGTNQDKTRLTLLGEPVVLP
jgi:uncharacterized repeat protein (TIGR01451 family)